MAASVVQDTKEKGVKYVSTYYNNNLAYIMAPSPFFKNCKMVAISWSRNYSPLTPKEYIKKKENVWYQRRFTTKMLRPD